jgi:predicted nucleic acid-binding protein
MSDQRLIVSNTGPLITLEKLSDGYAFIRELYDRLLIPPTVLEELFQGQFVNAQAYLEHYGVADLLEVVEVNQSVLAELKDLDQGEQEAIQLALERGLPLLIEEEAGRSVARQLGVSISGIAGQVLRAFREQILTAEETLNKLHELFTSRRINTRIYRGLVETVRREV